MFIVIAPLAFLLVSAVVLAALREVRAAQPMEAPPPQLRRKAARLSFS
jgi:hypothetical protein